MSGHPCRAHHKLKWARKIQLVLVLLYKQVPRSESNKSISTQSFTAYPNSARSTLFDRGWQQPLNCHEAQSACRVKDAEGTAQPLVLDPARWLCYLARPQAVPVAAKSKILPERMVLPSQHMSRRSRSDISTAMLASNPRLNPSKAPAEAFLSSAPYVGTHSSAQQRHILRPDTGSNVSARYKLRGALIKSVQQRPLVFNPCS